MSAPAKVLVAIPMYNEAATIAEVIASVRTHVPAATILVVSDGCSDGGPAVVDGLGVRQIRLPCNLGYTRALQTAMRYAIREGVDRLVTFDADGQHDASEIPRLLEALDGGDADVIIGSRFAEAGGPSAASVGRGLGIAAFARLTSLILGTRITDTTSGFRAYRGATLPRLLSDHFVDMHAEVLIYLGKLGQRIVEVPVRMHDRTAGQSMYSWTSFFWYPLETGLLICITLIQAWRARRAEAP